MPRGCTFLKSFGTVCHFNELIECTKDSHGQCISGRYASIAIFFGIAKFDSHNLFLIYLINKTNDLNFKHLN